MNYCVIPTPIGPLAICEEEGAICTINFTGSALCPPATPLLQEAARQLTAYFAGTLTDFDLPLRLEGTAFRMQCWQALCTIPYGETISQSSPRGRRRESP